mmetsp:Transcript_47134/g.90948  ORF Transcript_47134/g.90948 Transcript_47134/m.90948 type:complete len:216 (+) Transcript_47134:342-989(+)
MYRIFRWSCRSLRILRFAEKIGLYQCFVSLSLPPCQSWAGHTTAFAPPPALALLLCRHWRFRHSRASCRTQRRLQLLLLSRNISLWQHRRASLLEFPKIRLLPAFLWNLCSCWCHRHWSCSVCVRSFEAMAPPPRTQRGKSIQLCLERGQCSRSCKLRGNWWLQLWRRQLCFDAGPGCRGSISDRSSCIRRTNYTVPQCSCRQMVFRGLCGCPLK